MNAIDLMIYDPIAREGDFVDHPADKGGPTRWGITEGVSRRFGYMDRMERLPRDVAVAIYKRQYSHAPGFDKVAQIDPKLAVELFDTGVNMGTGTAICFLQRAPNALKRHGLEYSDIAVHRKIGNATLQALSEFFNRCGTPAETVLTKEIDALQGAHYVRLAETRPSQEAFLYGWLANRIG